MTDDLEPTTNMNRRRALQLFAGLSAVGLAGRGSAATTAVSSDSDDVLADSELDDDVFSDETVDVNGASLHHVIGGDGPPVFFLHGWPQTWYEWKDVMPDLAEEHTVVAVDMRGTGESDASPASYHKGTLAEDIRCLVEHLGFDEISLAGHDIGGMVGTSTRTSTRTIFGATRSLTFRFPASSRSGVRC